MKFISFIFLINCLINRNSAFSQTQSSESFGVAEENQDHEVFYENGKRGLKSNVKNKILVQAKYDDIRLYKEDGTERFAFVDLDSNVGLYSIGTEEILLDSKYYDIKVIAKKSRFVPGKMFTNYCFLVKNHAKKLALFIYNSEFKNLNKIVDFDFSDYKSMNDSLIALKKDDKWSVFNLNSMKFYYQKEFDSVDKLSSRIGYTTRENKNFLLFKQNNKFGLGDLAGNQKLECIYDSITGDKKFIICWSGKKATAFNDNLEILSNDSYVKTIVIDRHLIATNVQKKWGIINLQNIIVIPFQYDSIKTVNLSSNYGDNKDYPSDFIAIAVEKNNVDLYKIKNDVKLLTLKETKFEKILMTKIVLSQNNKQGVYDQDLNLVCDFKYDKLNLWYGKVYKHNFVGKINADLYFIGDNITFDSIRADSVFIYDQSAYVAIRNNKYALVNRDQKVETEFSYDYISKKMDFGPHFFRVGNEFGLIDNMGKEIGARKTNLKNGYTDFTQCANDLITIFKSENDSLLLDFARKITPDYWSYVAWNQYLADYRGVFKNFTNDNYESAIQVMYKDLLDFRKRFSSKNELVELTTCGFDFNQLGEMEVSFHKIKVPVTESPIVIFTKDKTYKLKLGELLVIDGQIKSFTRPKFVQ